VTLMQSATKTASAPSVHETARANLSEAELETYGRLLDALIHRLAEREQVKRFAVHGSDLVAFTDRRILSLRRGLFDFNVRSPRVRSIPYGSIRELKLQAIGEAAMALILLLDGRRRPLRLYFPTSEADRLAGLVAAAMSP
jgi:hypothetical protein